MNTDEGSIWSRSLPVYVCAKGHEGTTAGGWTAYALLVQFDNGKSVGPFCARCAIEELAARFPMTRKETT